MSPSNLIAKRHPLSVVAVLLATTLAPAGVAQARRHRRPPPPPVPSPVQGADAALRLDGFRVYVEPEIVQRAPGRLWTRSLTWKVRAVFVDPDGYEVLARVHLGPGSDSQILVNRRWEATDFARQSRLFRKRRKALRRYDGLRRSPDITLLKDHPDVPAAQVNVGASEGGATASAGGAGATVSAGSGGATVHVVVTGPGPGFPPPPGPSPASEPPAAAAPPLPPDCRKLVIDKGFAPMHMKECEGADPWCAEALLNAGHNPIHLSECRGVQTECAVKLLEKGHSPIHLSECKPGIAVGCALALLDAGHSPIHLDECMGVDEQCAIMLLQAGKNPIQLDECKR